TVSPAHVGDVSITVPTDYSGNFTASAVANTDRKSVAYGKITVTVSATADVTVTANDVSGTETNAPVTIALDLSTLITDIDGSETLTDVVITYTGTPAVMAATIGTLVRNVLTVSPAHVGDVSITVPTDYSGNFTASAVAN